MDLEDQIVGSVWFGGYTHKICYVARYSCKAAQVKVIYFRYLELIFPQNTYFLCQDTFI